MVRIRIRGSVYQRLRILLFTSVAFKSFQDAKNSYKVLTFPLLTYTAGTFTSALKNDKLLKSIILQKIGFFFILMVLTEKSGTAQIKTGPDPGGQQSYGSYGSGSRTLVRRNPHVSVVCTYCAVEFYNCGRLGEQ